MEANGYTPQRIQGGEEETGGLSSWGQRRGIRGESKKDSITPGSHKPKDMNECAAMNRMFHPVGCRSGVGRPDGMQPWRSFRALIYVYFGRVGTAITGSGGVCSLGKLLRQLITNGLYRSLLGEPAPLIQGGAAKKRATKANSKTMAFSRP